jgi:hypothetical protein
MVIKNEKDSEGYMTPDEALRQLDVANATIATLGREKTMLEARFMEYNATTHAAAARFDAELKSYADAERARLYELQAENSADKARYDAHMQYYAHVCWRLQADRGAREAANAALSADNERLQADMIAREAANAELHAEGARLTKCLQAENAALSADNQTRATELATTNSRFDLMVTLLRRHVEAAAPSTGRRRLSSNTMHVDLAAEDTD